MSAPASCAAAAVLFISGTGGVVRALYCFRKTQGRGLYKQVATLARVRKLSRNTPALQFNIATSGGQQVNLRAIPT